MAENIERTLKPVNVTPDQPATVDTAEMVHISSLALLKMLKHASLEGHLHFISFIINNSEKIKFLDNFKIYDYSMKSILNKTLLQVFNIKNWTSLVETAIINDNIYNLFIKNEKQEVPSYEIMIATYDIFSIVYNEPLQDMILHVLSSTSDNYMLYCMTQWLKESKKDKMDLKISLNQTNLKMFNDLMKSLTSCSDLSYFNAHLGHPEPFK
mgnify:CR=1 FL=1